MRSQASNPRRGILGWLAAGGALLYLLLVELTGLMPRCILKATTGFDCPGCGSQRALRALLHGHPLQAWSYNLLLPFLVAYALALLILPRIPGPRVARLQSALTSPAAIYILLAAILAWWLLRNILHL